MPILQGLKRAPWATDLSHRGATETLAAVEQLLIRGLRRPGSSLHFLQRLPDEIVGLIWCASQGRHHAFMSAVVSLERLRERAPASCLLGGKWGQAGARGEVSYSSPSSDGGNGNATARNSFQRSVVVTVYVLVPTNLPVGRA